jgi:hypothetical protein
MLGSAVDAGGPGTTGVTAGEPPGGVAVIAGTAGSETTSPLGDDGDADGKRMSRGLLLARMCGPERTCARTMTGPAVVGAVHFSANVR